MRQLLVDPAEAAGIESLADELEMSLSELVTLAIDNFYGGAGSNEPVTAGGRRKQPRSPAPHHPKPDPLVDPALAAPPGRE